ncbi:MAG: NAD(P)/FAD-dependent oxidoreductase [Solirubrobacterales bacterium]|nr:NAD(P)/FAD-dependent oxidoreductase [Solirubrobacterales bacterium]
MADTSDIVVIGAGHNGLACASYLARAGLSVTVLESSDTPGGCIFTQDQPSGNRLELGGYEHGGIRASGVTADLELESRYGLKFHEREEILFAPCDDGTPLAFWNSLERTVESLAETVGREEAERYRAFSNWSSAAMNVLGQAESGPPPSIRSLAAVADATLGSEGSRLMQALFAPATAIAEAAFEDDRLRGPLNHWAAHSQQPPQAPGTGAGALFLAASHGAPAIRPAGGSRGTVDALVRCLEDSGGSVICSAAAERVELFGGRARAVIAGGERYEARKAVISAIDARRLFLGLMDEKELPSSLVAEVKRIHFSQHNVAELKVDAVIDLVPHVNGPDGMERAFMLSANTGTDIARAFSAIGLGQLPERPPVMIAFPSVLESGWAPEGQGVVWLSTFVPWTPENGPWDRKLLEEASDLTWKTAEKALGYEMTAVERKITGPEDWVARHGNPGSNPNHIEMSIDQLMGMRPSVSLSGYSTPVPGLFLTGAGTHPGGGITGVPGRNSAAVVMEHLGITKRARMKKLRTQAAMLKDALKATRELRKNA